MQLNSIKKWWPKRENKVVKRMLPILWRKMIPGVLMVGVGVFLGNVYLQDTQLIFFGVGAAAFIGPGVLLVYQSFKSGEGGFSFKGKRRYTGKENTIILFARRNGGGTKDVPLRIGFHELKSEHIPKRARLHYVRNIKKHFYELLYNPVTKKLEPVTLPDKKSFPPELFKIPATMQPYKDYMEYSPPTLFQKIAPGILLLAMGIVGILMVMTTG